MTPSARPLVGRAKGLPSWIIRTSLLTTTDFESHRLSGKVATSNGEHPTRYGKDESVSDKRYTEVRETKDVTSEVMSIAEYAADFFEGRVEWDDVWDRMDGSILADGSTLDMGGSNSTPAMRTIQRRINAARRD